MANWDKLLGEDLLWRKRKGFFPENSLNERKNIFPLFSIAPDGAVILGIHLAVENDRIREQIICTHFLQQLTKFLNTPLGVWIINRDKPWDFEIGLSLGRKFNIEITSISENEKIFKNRRHIELIRLQSGNSNLPLSLLSKLNSFFPDEQVTSLIERHRNDAQGKNALVENPYFGKERHGFLTWQPGKKTTLENLIARAITSKSSKNHEGKNHTVLIIDNRTCQFDIDDFDAAAKKFQSDDFKNDFAEVWLYTGYYSDNDGNNAEYSLIPIKLPLHS